MNDTNKSETNTFHFLRELKISLIATVALLLLLCGVYPLVIWGLGNVAFHHQAEGSLVRNAQGTVIGSELLGQGFTSDKYFHSRPSAAGNGYDATSSGGSNLGQTSQKLIDSLKARIAVYRKENSLDSTAQIPGDAVTASASGLDPEISLDNALIQASRVVKARGIERGHVEALIHGNLRGRGLGFLGEPGVNVLQLNLALDTLK